MISVDCDLHAQGFAVILTKQSVCLASSIFKREIPDFPSVVLTSGDKFENA